MNTLVEDIKEKQKRLNKTRADIKAASYDERLAEKNSRGQALEDRKEQLTTEFLKLGMQSDARAKLEHRRGEIKNKTAELRNTSVTISYIFIALTSSCSFEAANVIFRRLVGVDTKMETIEKDVDRLSLSVSSVLSSLLLTSCDQKKGGGAC